MRWTVRCLFRPIVHGSAINNEPLMIVPESSVVSGDEKFMNAATDVFIQLQTYVGRYFTAAEGSDQLRFNVVFDKQFIIVNCRQVRDSFYIIMETSPVQVTPIMPVLQQLHEKCGLDLEQTEGKLPGERLNPGDTISVICKQGIKTCEVVKVNENNTALVHYVGKGDVYQWLVNATSHIKIKALRRR